MYGSSWVQRNDGTLSFRSKCNGTCSFLLSSIFMFVFFSAVLSKEFYVSLHVCCDMVLILCSSTMLAERRKQTTNSKNIKKKMLAHTWHVTSFLCMTAYGVSRRVENHVAMETVSRFPYVGGITLDSHPPTPSPSK